MPHVVVDGFEVVEGATQVDEEVFEVVEVVAAAVVEGESPDPSDHVM